MKKIKVASILSKKEFNFFKKIKKKFKDSEIYLVGGAFRDFLMHKTIKDLDILIRNVPIKTLQKFLEKLGKIDFVGKKFGVLKFKASWVKREIDIAIPRTEISIIPGKRRGFKILYNHKLPIEEDLKRRDFTINAMAINIFTNEIIDPFNGINDIKNKIIRAVENPENRLKEDLTRILRAIRFSICLNFKIEENTKKAIKKLSKLLKNQKLVSYEMISEEILKALNCDIIKTIEYLENYKILEILIPEIKILKKCNQPKRWHKEGNVWRHTKLALLNLQKIKTKIYITRIPEDRFPELILALLFHDFGKPKCKIIKNKEIKFIGHEKIGAKIAEKIIQRLKLTAPYDFDININRIKFLIEKHLLSLHSKAEELRNTTIKKYFLDDEILGEEFIKLLICDGIASIPKTGSYDLSNIKKLIKRIKKLKTEIEKNKKKPKALLSGFEIMDILGLKPGPVIGEIKEKLLEAQLQGVIKTRVQARKFIKSILNSTK